MWKRKNNSTCAKHHLTTPHKVHLHTHTDTINEVAGDFLQPFQYALFLSNTLETQYQGGHNQTKWQHNHLIVRNKKSGNENHQSQLCCYYFLLLLATCCGFCRKPSSPLKWSFFRDLANNFNIIWSNSFLTSWKWLNKLCFINKCRFKQGVR